MAGSSARAACAVVLTGRGVVLGAEAVTVFSSTGRGISALGDKEGCFAAGSTLGITSGILAFAGGIGTAAGLGASFRFTQSPIVRKNPNIR